MRRTLSAIALAALVVLAVIVAVQLVRRRGAPASATPAVTGPGPGSGSAVTALPGVTAGSGPAAPARVHRLDPVARRELGAQIAAARERARTTGASAGAQPALPDDTMTLEQVGGPAHDALREAIPLLAECYTRQAYGEALKTATVRMTMTSDPELGTVIDTEAIRDRDDQPLDPKLDECLRDTIDSLELPPLGAGGKLPLEYSFRF